MTELLDVPVGERVSRRAPRPRGTRPVPTLRHERALLGAGALLVAGMDEVGRGALAGPVSVGVVVVDAATRPCPSGVADSKLLSAARRDALLPGLRGWGVARAVGHASPEEIDARGIVGALRLAGTRALACVEAVCGPVDAVVLDGSHDWLTEPGPDLLDVFGRAEAVARAVHLRVKADQVCSSVAAASILAKCERDAHMVTLAGLHPEYGWAGNKGYGSADHVAALRRHGPSAQHRRSWNLPRQDGG